MKHNKQTALLLSLLLALPCCSGLSVKAMTRSHLYAAPEGAYGYVSDDAAEGSLPERFDLREKGLVSPIREQENYQTGWAFAAVQGIESSLISRDPKIDLSEWQLACSMYSHTFGYPADKGAFLQEEASDKQIMGLLAGRIGPVKEENAPYGDMDYADKPLTMEELQAQAAYHVTDVYTYPYLQEAENFSEQCEAVKQSVYEGNAVSFSYIHAENCYSEAFHSYYYDPDRAEMGDMTGHSACIVGWDDTFPAEQFNTDPGRDGAWLVKNSWGTNWGEFGCFWISYADDTINSLLSFEAVPADGSTLYQHDDFGCFGSFSADPSGDEAAWISNMFTAEQDMWVTSVMLCCMEADDVCEITVYKGCEESMPQSGEASAITSTILSKTGYQTIALAEPVFVEAGQRFSVTARLSGNKGWHIPCEYATHTERTDPDGTVRITDSAFSIEMLSRQFQAGESFFSSDGVQWQDMADLTPEIVSYTAGEDSSVRYESTTRYGNICLKAVTHAAGSVTFSENGTSLPAGTKIALSCEENVPIYYSVNNGEYQLYEDPIPFSEEMTVYAYPEGKSNTVSIRHYREQEAQISSILCAEDAFCWYADPTSEPNTFHYYTEKGVRSIGIMPVSTGTVMYEDQVLSPGKLTEISVPGGKTTLTFTVTEEGIGSSEYYLIVEELEDTGSPSPLIGDVDLNGNIDITDATLILRYIAYSLFGDTPDQHDPEWMIRADYDQDQIITVQDASGILKYIALSLF